MLSMSKIFYIFETLTRIPVCQFYKIELIQIKVGGFFMIKKIQPTLS